MFRRKNRGSRALESASRIVMLYFIRIFSVQRRPSQSQHLHAGAGWRCQAAETQRHGGKKGRSPQGRLKNPTKPSHPAANRQPQCRSCTRHPTLAHGVGCMIRHRPPVACGVTGHGASAAAFLFYFIFCFFAAFGWRHVAIRRAPPVFFALPLAAPREPVQ